MRISIFPGNCVLCANAATCGDIMQEFLQHRAFESPLFQHSIYRRFTFTPKTVELVAILGMLCVQVQHYVAVFDRFPTFSMQCFPDQLITASLKNVL